MAGIELATAYVNITSSAKGLGKSITDQFRDTDRAAQQAGDQAGSKFTSAAGSQFKKLAAFAAGAFAVDKVKDFFGDAISEASALQQNVGAMQSVFKDASGEIARFGKTSSDTVGIAKQDYFQLAAVFGSQLKNMGVSADQLAPKTNQLVTLGADLAAVYGGTASDAVEAISSLLRGERDPIERYGVSIKQASIDAYELAHGLDTSTASAKTNSDMQATLALLFDQTKDAQGQYADQLDTTAEAQQRANAKWKEAQAQIGEKLLPVVTDLTNFASDNLIPALGTVASITGDVVGAVSTAVGWFGKLPGPVKDTALALGAVAVAAKFGWIDKLTSGVSAARGALSGFRTSWSRIGDDAAMAGVSRARAGLGLLADGAKKAGSSVVAAFGGPWGIALAAAPLAIDLVTDAFKSAAPAAHDFTDAIDDQTGALKDNWAQIIANKLANDGTIDKLNKIGVSTADYTAALMGNEDAYKRVSEAAQKHTGFEKVGGEVLDQLYADRKQYDEQIRHGAQAQQAATEIQKQATGATQEGTAAAKRDADARAAARKVINEQTAALKQGAAAAQAKADADDEAFNRQLRGRTEVKLTAEEIKRARDVAAKYGDSWQRMGGQVKVSADAVKDARSPVERMKDAIAIFNDKVSEGDTRLKFFAISVDRLAGRNVSLEEATKLLNDQVREVAKAFDDATKATKGHIESLIGVDGRINTTTEAGSNLYDSVSQYRNAYDTATTAAYQNAVSSGRAADALKDARNAANAAREKFLKQADALGINRTKAEKMADAMGILEGKKLTDKNFNIGATDNATPVVDSVAKKLRDLPSTKNVTLNVQARALAGQGITSSFSVANLYMADGGWVTGGIPGRDSVPRILMPGEAVIPTDIAQANKDIINAMLGGRSAPTPAAAPAAAPQQLTPSGAPLIGQVVIHEQMSPERLAGELGRKIMFHAPVMAR